MDVVKDNFSWVVENRVLDGKFIDKWSVEFSVNEIWHNQSVSRGYLIVSGNTTVIASDNTTVIASGNTTVMASGYTTVIAYDNTTVRASGNTYVSSMDIIECKLSEAAIWKIQKINTVRYADDAMKFEKIPQ